VRVHPILLIRSEERRAYPAEYGMGHEMARAGFPALAIPWV